MSVTPEAKQHREEEGKQAYCAPRKLRTEACFSCLIDLVTVVILQAAHHHHRNITMQLVTATRTIRTAGACAPYTTSTPHRPATMPPHHYTNIAPPRHTPNTVTQLHIWQHETMPEGSVTALNYLCDHPLLWRINNTNTLLLLLFGILFFVGGFGEFLVGSSAPS